MENLVSITHASGYIGISPVTIKRWYKWWGSLNECDKPLSISLPVVYNKDKRGTWYFKFEDLEMLIHFKQKLPRGAMADFNAKVSWGQYGKRIIAKKEKENEKDDKRKRA